MIGSLHSPLSCAAVKWTYNRRLQFENACFLVDEKNAGWGEASKLFETTPNVHIFGVNESIEEAMKLFIVPFTASPSKILLGDAVKGTINSFMASSIDSSTPKSVKISGTCSNESVVIILSRCCGLINLELNSFRVTSEVLGMVKLSNLQRFDIRGCVGDFMKEVDMVSFIKKHRKLKQLDFNMVEFDNSKGGLNLLKTIGETCVDLQYLDIVDSCDLNDDVLEVVLVGCQDLVYFAFDRSNVTNTGITKLASKAMRLHTLKIHDSRCASMHLTTSYIMKLAFCVHLETLELTSMVHIEDIAFQTILACCTKLRFVTFTDCKLLSDAAFIKLDCPLQYLDVDGCALTDVGICTIVDRCRSLQEIVITDCVKLTNASIIKLQTIVNIRIHCNDANNDSESDLDWGDDSESD